MAKCKGKDAKGHVKKGWKIVKGKRCPVKVSTSTRRRSAPKKRRAVKAKARKRCTGRVSVKGHSRSCPKR